MAQMRALLENADGKFARGNNPKRKNVFAHVAFVCNENFQEVLGQGLGQLGSALLLAPFLHTIKAHIVQQVTLGLSLEKSILCIRKCACFEVHCKRYTK